VPDVSTNQVPQSSNSNNVNSQPQSNFSPWQDELDVAAPEQKKPTISTVGTFGENGVFQNKPAQPPVQVPAAQNQPLAVPKFEETIGKKVPAEQYLKPGVAANVSQGQPVNPQTVAQPTAPTQPDSQSQSVNPIKNDIAPTANNIEESNPQKPYSPPPSSRSDTSNDDVFSNKKKKLPSLGRLGSLIFTILFFIVASIILTETGLFSIGFEKVYGAIGLEKLWGGLSVSTSKAVARSFLAMQSQSDVKIRGGISLKVSDNGKSKIIDPLLQASKVNVGLLNDEQLGGVVTKAIKAIYDSNSVTDALVDDDVFSNWEDDSSDTATDTDSSSSSSDSDDMDDQSSSVTDTAQSSSSAFQTEGTEQIADTPTDELLFDLTGAFSKEGSEVILQGKKNVGERYFDSILLRKAEDKLWVKSAVSKFASNYDPQSWMEYSLPQYGSQSVYKSFFGSKNNSELVLVGHRLSNADFMGVRCFKYSIDSLRIGDQFKDLGLTQSMVKSISGEVTIGIRDKLIRKINLTITPNSETASSINVFLDFYDYGTKNNFITPEQSEVKVAGSTTTPVPATETPSVPTNANDTQRKSDLSTIASALTAYKAAKGSYPIATGFTKLNETNSLTRLLIPKYAASFPPDPKSSDGWWYGYKSTDGSTYSLSARLENVLDTSGQSIDGLYLYIITPAGPQVISTTPAPTQTASVTDNDTRRKDDLLLIKTALNTYYLRFNRYPIAKDYVRLDERNNPIKEILVPDFLSAVPEDPKSADGWYYAYKSDDGIKYTLSARLEDPTDSEGVIVSGNNLYFLSSN